VITTVGEIMGKSILHRKDSLIITAIEIIDERGILALSTREIAKRQGVSEATLFRHYKSKNELLIAVLEYFMQFDEDIFLTTQKRGLAPKEAIVHFISLLSGYYENYPAITSIMQMIDVLRYEPELEEKVKNIFNKRIEIIKQLVEEAQAKGEICKDIDSQNIAIAISGFCREMCLKWRLENKSFLLKEQIISMLSVLFGSVSL
jgi:AcrR family transcriptional regulator